MSGTGASAPTWVQQQLATCKPNLSRSMVGQCGLLARYPGRAERGTCCRTPEPAAHLIQCYRHMVVRPQRGYACTTSTPATNRRHGTRGRRPVLAVHLVEARTTRSGKVDRARPREAGPCQEEGELPIPDSGYATVSLEEGEATRPTHHHRDGQGGHTITEAHRLPLRTSRCRSRIDKLLNGANHAAQPRRFVANRTGVTELGDTVVNRPRCGPPARTHRTPHAAGW